MTNPLVPFRKPVVSSLTFPERPLNTDPCRQLIQQIELHDDLVPVQMRSLITQMRTYNETRMGVILDDLSKFSQSSTHLLKRLDTLIQKIATDERDVTEIATTVMQVTKATMGLLHDSVQQCLALQAKGRSILTTSTSQVLFCLLNARNTELSQIQEELEICYTQENHALAQELQMRSKVMTLESNHCNRILDLSDAKEVSRVKKLEHEDAMEAEDREHSKRLTALAEERVHQQSSHQTQMQTMDAAARCQIAALIAELKKQDSQ